MPALLFGGCSVQEAVLVSGNRYAAPAIGQRFCACDPAAQRQPGRGGIIGWNKRQPDDDKQLAARLDWRLHPYVHTAGAKVVQRCGDHKRLAMNGHAPYRRQKRNIDAWCASTLDVAAPHG